MLLNNTQRQASLVNNYTRCTFKLYSTQASVIDTYSVFFKVLLVLEMVCVVASKYSRLGVRVCTTNTFYAVISYSIPYSFLNLARQSFLAHLVCTLV